MTKIDLYTKVVLTVITLGVGVLAVQPHVIKPAQAQLPTLDLMGIERGLSRIADAVPLCNAINGIGAFRN